MNQILVTLSITMHALATVVFIGHPVLLALVYLPALEKTVLAPAVGPLLREISRRSRNWSYGALLVFMVTGAHLMFDDPAYLGIGNFKNAWSVLMLLKHAVILGMIGIGWWYNASWRVHPSLDSASDAAQALARLRLYSICMAVAGMVVLILTAAAQAQ